MVGVCIADESAVAKHRADGRFVVGINHGVSGKRVGHSKILKRHVVFTNSVINYGMKAEIFRGKLVDFVVG